MLDLRNKVHAHVDASGPDQFRRKAHYEVMGKGGERSGVSGTSLLDQAGLKEMADLADRIISTLEGKRRDAYQVLAHL